MLLLCVRVIRVWGYGVESYGMLFHCDFIFVYLSVDTDTQHVVCVGWVTVVYSITALINAVRGRAVYGARTASAVTRAPVPSHPAPGRLLVLCASHAHQDDPLPRLQQGQEDPRGRQRLGDRVFMTTDKKCFFHDDRK